MDNLSITQIRNSFDFIDGGDTVDSYDYIWETVDGDRFELYIHAPNGHIDPDQITEFNLFMKNKTVILYKMDSRMREFLEQNKTSVEILNQPLQIAILSVMHQGKDFESEPCEYTIELICSKIYKTFLRKKSFDMVAQVKHGQLLRILE